MSIATRSGKTFRHRGNRSGSSADEPTNPPIKTNRRSGRRTSGLLRGYFSGRSIRLIVDLLSIPLTLRRRLTGASATLLIVWIASLNVVWQFPFLGLFAASLSILLVTLVVNTAVRPFIHVRASFPQFVAAGRNFGVQFFFHNRRRIPAMHCRVALMGGRRHRSLEHPAIGWIDYLPPASSARSSGPVSIRATMTAHRRGRQTLPSLQIMSTFPFAFWRMFAIGRVDASILVTPNPTLDDAPAAIGRLAETAVRWIEQRREEDVSDYAGSREYVIGETVRQWDYRAWARLDKPMIRTPPRANGGQTTLIVDPVRTQDQRVGIGGMKAGGLKAGGIKAGGIAAARIANGRTTNGRTTNGRGPNGRNGRFANVDDADPAVEWLLRIAARMTEVTHAGKRLRMMVTGDQPAIRRVSRGINGPVDTPIQLALAVPIDALPDVQSIDPGQSSASNEASSLLSSTDLDLARRGDVLILTTREDLQPLRQLNLSAKIVTLSPTDIHDLSMRDD